MKKTNEKNCFILQEGYILGLLNTDGTFFLIFKKDKTMSLGSRLSPVVAFSLKKEKTFVLKDISVFLLENYNIKSKVKDKATKNSLVLKNQQRSHSLEIEGIGNVKKFLDFVLKSPISTPLVGLKYYDFSLMVSIVDIIEKKLHNTPFGRKQIIDLVRSLHIPPSLNANCRKCFLPYNLPSRLNKPIALSNRKPRKVLEKEHGFPEGSSLSMALEEISSNKNRYFLQCIKSSKKELLLQGNQVSGMLDGNGSLRLDKNQKLLGFNLTSPEGDESTLLSFAFYFGDKSPQIIGDGVKASIKYIACKSAVFALEKHFLLWPLQVR